jgi:alanine racemase
MPISPCWIEIQTRLLEANYRFLKSLAAPQMELLAIVKANAYGHSLELCAPAAVRAGAHWLGVTSVEEGVAARAVCPEAHVLVIGSTGPGQGREVIEHGLTPAVWEPWQLDELEAAARSAGAPAGSLPIHLEIDTGMSRQGVLPADIPTILARFTSSSPFRLEAVMTHLFAADELDGAATKVQLARLDSVLDQVEAAGLQPEWLSAGSSSSLLAGQAGTFAAMASRRGMKAMMRPGLALYGLAPRFTPQEPESVAAARVRLQPVLTWKSRVVGVRSVPTGAVVGYNGTFVATRPSRLALVPMGYADGLNRRLGNNFSLLVRGQRAPIAGRVSMDQIVLDVTDIPGVETSDEIVVIGTQGGETITAFDHAKVVGTIAWEIFTNIGARAHRIEV